MAISRYGTRFTSFGTGGKYSTNYESHELVPQFIERIKVQRSKFPILLISDKMKNHKPVKYKTYYHEESDELPLTVQANGAVNSTHTQVLCESGEAKYVRPYDQLYNPLTEEQLHVSAVNTTNHVLTVTRGVGNSGTGSAIADNQELLIMSQSNAEGGTSQSGQWGTSVQVSNYTMLTREPYEMTDEGQNTETYGYENPWQEQKTDASQRMARKMEWQTLFGKADSGNTSGYRSTGGIGSFASSHKFDAAGTLTEQALYNWIMDLAVDNGGIEDLIFYAGSYVLQYLDAWGRDKLYTRPEDQIAGIAISRYKTSFGDLKVVAHGMLTEVFDNNTTPELPGMIFGVNMSMLKTVFWRPLVNDEGPQGRGIQANDSLTKKGEWRAHWGCYVGDERKHGWMYGITKLT